MADGQSNFESDVLPVVIEWAANIFANREDKETMINDAISVAWENTQKSPEGVPAKSIAWFSVRQVSSRRHFRESERSCDSPIKLRRQRLERSSIDLSDIPRDGQNPARVAAFRIDFCDWLESLNDRERHVAELLGSGHTPGEVSKLLKLSPARVSQLRRQLADSWFEFRS